MMNLKTFIIGLFSKLWRISSAMARPAIVLILLLQTSHNTLLRAAFDDLGRGARTAGMADTFVGVADDANALYYNPAGLAQLDQAAITTEYGQLLRGQDDGSNLGITYLGYAYPFRRPKWGTIGVAYHNFKAANLLNERTIQVSYGWKMKVEPFGWKGTWLGGLGLKQLYREFQPDRFTENALNDAGVASGSQDPLFARNGYSNDAYALDLGGLYRFGRQNRYGAGISLMNINRPDVSLAGDNDKAPFIAKLGLAYRPNWGLMSVEVRRAKRLSSQSDTDVALGAERRFTLQGIGAFTLRGGYAEGSRDFKAVTAGASYHVGNAEIDYGFNFPVGTLADLQGSHRVGLTFRMGTDTSQEKVKEDIPDINILASFVYDSSASYALLTRAAKAGRIDDYQRLLLLQVPIRQYNLNDPGLKKVRKDLAKLLDDYKSTMMGWPELREKLLTKISPKDRYNAEDILNIFVKRDTEFALARMGVLEETSRQNPILTSLTLMGLAEIAAQSYRRNDIDSTLLRVKQMMDILPKDKAIREAYQQLLLERMRGREKAPSQKAHPIPYSLDEIELPEAPATLVAPKPVQEEEPKKEEPSELESKLRSYGESLGYYFTRKEAGATAIERQHLLKQMLTLYGDSGIDLSLVKGELNAVKAELKDKTMKKPAIPKDMKPAPKKIIPVKKDPEPKPKPVTPKVPEIKKNVIPPEMSSEFKDSWRFYEISAQRGITDQERLEILEAILLRFGEQEAGKVTKELERIRRRIE